MKKIVTLLLFLGLIGCQNQPKEIGLYEVPLSNLYKINSNLTTRQHPVYEQEVAYYEPMQSGEYLQLPYISSDVLRKAQYLVLEGMTSSDKSTILYINFFEDSTAEKPNFFVKIGILPHLPTQIIFPLSYLDAERVYMERFPRQLKGTCAGRRIAPDNIQKITLHLDNVQREDGFSPNLYIASLKLTDVLPAPLPKLTKPVVDKFGQWMAKEWKGKIHSLQELKDTLNAWEQRLQGVAYTSQWSKYGGWKGKKLKATGYFYTHHDGKRWWLVDPEGYGFLSNGIDGIRAIVSGPIEDFEELFEEILEVDDSLKKDVYHQREGGKLEYNFLVANLIRVYGQDWKNHWQKTTRDLLTYSHFNTIANWSDTAFIRYAQKPYVYPLKGFPTTTVSIYRDMPDVFDSAYRDSARKFAEQLIPLKNDPYMIGYFLRNEPLWGFADESLNIAFEMMATDKQSYTKKAFADWLKNKYSGNVAQFCKAWGVNVSSFDEINHLVINKLTDVSKQAVQEMYEFSEIIVREYVRVPSEEVKKVDAHHLNLGMRYAWISTPLLYTAGEFFDVFSINGYNSPAPPPTEEISRRSGKPVLIGEYHHGTTDRGLPANGIQGAISTQERGVAYRYYCENGFARPEIVGLHYFIWNDQPVHGRFDGENYGIGLVNVCNIPYSELLDSMRLTNLSLYEVATGKIQPYSSIIKKVPQIFY